MVDVLKSLITQFMPFAQEKIGFERPPRLFLKQDSQNAQNPLGKTAYYDRREQSVTLYITDRHPKDVLRSLGHELVHHKQNCDGKFDDIQPGDMGEGYAQSHPGLRDMEFEANSKGSMALRDFEDHLKKENTIYYEHLQKGEKQMSIKDWKNKEVSQLLSEAWGFKFNSLQEFEEFDGNGELQAEGEEEDQRAARKQRKGREDHQRKIREDDDESLEEGEEVQEEGVLGTALKAANPVLGMATDAVGLTGGDDKGSRDTDTYKRDDEGEEEEQDATPTSGAETADTQDDEGDEGDEKELDERHKPDNVTQGRGPARRKKNLKTGQKTIDEAQVRWAMREAIKRFKENQRMNGKSKNWASNWT